LRQLHARRYSAERDGVIGEAENSRRGRRVTEPTARHLYSAASVTLYR